MNFGWKLLLVIGLCAVVTACGKNSSSQTEDHHPQNLGGPVLMEVEHDDVAFRVVKKTILDENPELAAKQIDTLNQFELLISMNDTHWRSAQVFLEGDNQDEILIYDARKSSFPKGGVLKKELNLKSSPWGKHRYCLRIHREGKARFEDEFELVSDAIIQGDIHLSDVLATKVSGGEPLEIAILYFFPGGRLITNGENLNIKAQLLISGGGSIESFAGDQKKSLSLVAPSVGRASGNIQITAEKASGVLMVNLSGQDGGDGLAGTRGSDHPEISHTCAKGGIAGFLCSCGIVGQQMAPGLRGSPGGNGTDGGAGGSVGRAEITIQENQNFFAKVSLSAGKGGAAGPAGSGGLGGQVRIQPYNELCPQRGPSGDNGASGSAGAPGQSGVACVKLGAEVERRCWTAG